MVSSVNNNQSYISQIALWIQQQQAQLNATSTTTNPSQENGASVGSVQGTSGISANNFVYGPSALGGDSLFAVLQTQQVSSSPGTASSVTQSSGQSSSFWQDFQNLVSSLQSGDLAGAQQAYSTLTTLQTSNGSNNSSGTSTGSESQNPFQQALAQIGSDLQSNNLTGAQQVLSSLQQTQGGHHHHHHGGAGSSSTASANGLAGALLGTDSDGDTDGSGSKTAVTGSASSQPGTITETNADGSTTTITTNADGSVTTSTTPSTQTASLGNSPGNTGLQDLLAALQQAGIG